MRFQVPQFIDIEDRIIGPLTLKMFGYYVVAGMVLVPMYVLLDLSLFITLALPIVGMAALFAHVRLQGQSLARILLHAITFFVNPRIYLWRRGGSPYQMVIKGEEYNDFSRLPDTSSSLNMMAQRLNTQGNVSAQDAADPMVDEEGVEEVGNDSETPTALKPAPDAQPPGPRDTDVKRDS